MPLLLAVAALHGWLLGGARLWFPAGHDFTAPDTDAPTWQTRVVPAAAPTPPAAVAAPPAPLAPPRPARQAAAPVRAPDTAAAEDSASFSPLAPADIAPAAPESIANPPPSPAPESAPSLPAHAPAAPERPARYAFPPPVRLHYDVSALTGGNRNTAGAHISWTHDGSSYQASLLVTKFLLHMRQWTSKGTLGETGLAPVRFGDKGRGSEVAAHFVREEGKVVFSANTPEAALLPGAQDHLSVFMQLASLWAGEPQRYAAGDSISFQSIGPRQSETWTFVVSPEESITVPGGTFPAIKLTRDATGDYSTKAELWLAPKLAYLPAHIRLTETNGNVLDMVWTDSEQP